MGISFGFPVRENLQGSTGGGCRGGGDLGGGLGHTEAGVKWPAEVMRFFVEVEGEVAAADEDGAEVFGGWEFGLDEIVNLGGDEGGEGGFGFGEGCRELLRIPLLGETAQRNLGLEGAGDDSESADVIVGEGEEPVIV